MIVYTNTISKFLHDVDERVIADIIQDRLKNTHIAGNNESEYRSWENSLLHMMTVLSSDQINQDLDVAIEY
jgi:hypothetical protein